MRLLLTGASSGLGRLLLPRLEASPSVDEVWCGSRRPALGGEKVRSFALDLSGPFDLPFPGPIDLAIHVAGVAHAGDPALYDTVNREGTVKLARAARKKGCRRMVYVSTRCIGPGSGAYGESKRGAEAALLAMDWERLVIIRPAEVYGASGSEGIDAFIRSARKLHVVPMLFGSSNVKFAPIHAEDFVEIATGTALSPRNGVETLEVRGPETLDGIETALRLARRFHAMPIPVFVPALGFIRAAARCVGLNLFAPDQLARLTGEKSTGPFPTDPAKLRRFPG